MSAVILAAARRWECTGALEPACSILAYRIFINRSADRSIDRSNEPTIDRSTDRRLPLVGMDTGYGQDQVGHVRGVGRLAMGLLAT